ncbi:MAG: YihY/virulence factor BrkB family protein [Flavobacteriaceae bacterium]|nr:YihY/virulence factor BrkB family protein [Flavobacteriaceae bacterium]
MSTEIEEKLLKIPLVRNLVRFGKRIQLKSLEGLSLYDLLEMYFLGIVKGALSMRASAISYSLFLALFPALIFILNILPEIPIDDFADEFRVFITKILPSGSGEFFFDQIYDDIGKKATKGSWISTSFVLSIFLIGNGVNAIFGSFENSYHVHLTRNFVRQYLYSLGVGLMLTFLFLFTVAVILWFELYVVEYITDSIAKEMQQDQNVRDSNDILGATIVRAVFFFLMTYLSTAILYYFGTAHGRQAKFFSGGALMTAILYMVTSFLFGLYIDNFSKYNELYGAIGGLLILMLYIWINSNLLLLGFELNASIQRLKQKQENQEIIEDQEEREVDAV